MPLHVSAAYSASYGAMPCAREVSTVSSDMKDARWGLAMHFAGLLDKDWYAMDYAEKEKLLFAAQVELDKYPEDILFWSTAFRKAE